MLLAGELRKVWATEKDAKTPAGSIGEWAPTPQDPGRELTAEECFVQARAVLTSQLNHYEAKVHRKWGPRSEQPLTPAPRRGRRAQPEPPEENPILSASRGIEFPDLLSCLYLKLSDAIADQRLLRRCPACQRLFHPDRPNQDYCRTRCSNTYRRRQFAQRQQEQQIKDKEHGR